VSRGSTTAFDTFRTFPLNRCVCSGNLNEDRGNEKDWHETMTAAKVNTLIITTTVNLPADAGSELVEVNLCECGKGGQFCGAVGLLDRLHKGDIV